MNYLILLSSLRSSQEVSNCGAKNNSYSGKIVEHSRETKTCVWKVKMGVCWLPVTER